MRNVKPKYSIKLHWPHDKQREFIYSKHKRKLIRAGRRGGKTVGMSMLACLSFLEGKRVLYGAPTIDQLNRFWKEVTTVFNDFIETGLLNKNEAEHFIEMSPVGLKRFNFGNVPIEKARMMRITAKTCWNPDTLRGDYADLLILDEAQLLQESTWYEVGAPMLVDNNGDAAIIYTPPSLMSGASRATDPRWVSKLFRDAMQDGEYWKAFHFTTWDNPFVSKEALKEVTKDMSLESFRREILAEDDEIENNWLVYNAFNTELCKVERFSIPKSWKIYSGHDFGQSNPAALFIAQVGVDKPDGMPSQIRFGDFVVFKEYLPGGGLSTAQHVHNFMDMTAGYRIERSVGGNLTTEEEIRQSYTTHGWPIYPPKEGKANWQIDRTLGLMNMNKLYIFSDLQRLLGDLSNCLWDIDEQGMTKTRIKNEHKYHLLAALRYICSDFKPETATGGNIRVSRYGGRHDYVRIG